MFYVTIDPCRSANTSVLINSFYYFFYLNIFGIMLKVTLFDINEIMFYRKRKKLFDWTQNDGKKKLLVFS